MQLLTADLRKRLPTLHTSEEQGMAALALVHYFTPDSGWDWYATGFDGADIFFGLVRGFEVEVGYFSLTELQAVRGSRLLPVERDLCWEPKTLRQIKQSLKTLNVA